MVEQELFQQVGLATCSSFAATFSNRLNSGVTLMLRVADFSLLMIPRV